MYGLADYLFRSMPVVGTLGPRGGGVAAHPDNAYRLLRDQQQLVLVFPEGHQGDGQAVLASATSCAASGGAASSRSPCAPACPSCRSAVVGSEEAMPIVATLAAAGPSSWAALRPAHRQHAACSARWAGRPLPGQVQAPRPRPRSSSTCPPDQERYPRSQVFEEAEDIRQRMQENLYDMLRQRRSVWFG